MSAPWRTCGSSAGGALREGKSTIGNVMLSRVATSNAFDGHAARLVLEADHDHSFCRPLWRGARVERRMRPAPTSRAGSLTDASTSTLRCESPRAVPSLPSPPSPRTSQSPRFPLGSPHRLPRRDGWRRGTAHALACALGAAPGAATPSGGSRCASTSCWSAPGRTEVASHPAWKEQCTDCVTTPM